MSRLKSLIGVILITKSWSRASSFSDPCAAGLSSVLDGQSQNHLAVLNLPVISKRFSFSLGHRNLMSVTALEYN